MSRIYGPYAIKSRNRTRWRVDVADRFRRKGRTFATREQAENAIAHLAAEFDDIAIEAVDGVVWARYWPACQVLCLGVSRRSLDTKPEIGVRLTLKGLEHLRLLLGRARRDADIAALAGEVDHDDSGDDVGKEIDPEHDA